jgi:hypothetical protein
MKENGNVLTTRMAGAFSSLETPARCIRKIGEFRRGTLPVSGLLRPSISVYFGFALLMLQTTRPFAEVPEGLRNNSHTYTSRAWSVHGSTRTTKE